MSADLDRHPDAFARDWLKSIGAVRTHRGAGALVSEIAGLLGEDRACVAGVFSEAWQIETFGVLRAVGAPFSAALAANPAAVFEPRLRAALRDRLAASPDLEGAAPAALDRISGRIAEALAARLAGGVTLTRGQERALPELVALAMAGFALLRNREDRTVSEEAHPAIAPFMPLVREPLEARRRAALERERHRRLDWEEPFP